MTESVAWLALIIAAVSLGWQVWTHFRQPQVAAKSAQAVRRSERIEQTFATLRDALRPLNELLGNAAKDPDGWVPTSQDSFKLGNALRRVSKAWATVKADISDADIARVAPDPEFLRELAADFVDVDPLDREAILRLVRNAAAAIADLEVVLSAKLGHLE